MTNPSVLQMNQEELDEHHSGSIPGYGRAAVHETGYFGLTGEPGGTG